VVLVVEGQPLYLAATGGAVQFQSDGIAVGNHFGW
jgi:hypothetical protein